MPPIDPPLRAILEAVARSRPDAPASPGTADPADLADAADLAERRRQADATMLLASTGPESGVSSTDHRVRVPGGEIAVRVTVPHGVGPHPAVLFLHGGGWFQGNLDTAAVESGPLASAVPCAVVAVDYRLAPEHPFPTPLEDCVAAYRWLLATADELGVDRSRIAVAGTSAGANLAAALCLAARDRGLARPRLQMLEVPALDLTLSSPSIHAADTQAGLTGAMVTEFSGFYLPDQDQRTDPLASPLLAPDLSGLPPAVIVVAEHDPVRDDGERYLARLHEAGVPATAVRVLAHPHGGWVVPVTITHGLVLDMRVAALRRTFGGTLAPPWGAAAG
jgi:acetyl esterase